MRELMPHQKKALKFGQNRAHLALFMEMRLGKTLVAIRWAEMKSPSGRKLVIAPLSTLQGWADELTSEGQKFTWIQGDRVTRYQLASLTLRNWCLINFEALTPKLDSRRRIIRDDYEISWLPWDVVIVDESTRIRNPKASITKLMTRDFTAVPHRAILSGLPCPESPLDYVEQFRFLIGHFLGYKNYYVARNHLMVQLDQYDWTPVKGAREHMKNWLDVNSFTLSRKDAGIGSRKFYEKRVVAASPAQKKAMIQVEKEMAIGDTTTNYYVVANNWLARLAGGFRPETLEVLGDAKAKEILSLLKGELKNEKVVIWFRYNAEIEYVSNLLAKNGIVCDMITGETPTLNRRVIRERFQSESVDVLLIQLRVGQFGLDLSSSSTAIYYSNSYEYELRAQSEDRIIHPKKQEPLLYIDLVTEDSIDEDCINALRNKDVSAKTFMSNIVSNMLERIKNDYRH